MNNSTSRMKLKHTFQIFFLIVSCRLALSATGWADEQTETTDVRMHLPVLGVVNVATARPFTQCSLDMKYVASGGAIQETATGKSVCRLPRWQAFFGRGGTPRVMAFDHRHLRTIVCEPPSLQPVVAIPGQQPLWTTVWGKPLREVPLLLVPACEAEGRVELWDVDSLTKVLEVRDKNFYSDVLGPLTTNESLVASQAGNRLAWLDAHGNVHVWGLQGRTGEAAVFPKIAGARERLLCQSLFISPDGSRAAVIEFRYPRSGNPNNRADMALNILQLPQRSTTRVRWELDEGSLDSPRSLGLFFAPSGREIVLTSSRSPDYVFDIRTGRCLRSYEPATRGTADSSFRSPDLYARANASSSCFWVLSGLSPHLYRFRGYYPGVSPDGFYFVPRETNELIELASGRKIAFVGVEGAELEWPWFSADCRYLLGEDQSGTLPRDRAVAVLGLCDPAPGAAKGGDHAQTQWLLDMASRDPTRGQIAVRRLAHLSDSIVEPLLARVRFPTILSKIKPTIKNLDDESYATRERASRDLAAFGRLAERELSSAVTESGSAEVRARAARILASMDNSAERPEILAQLRALQVLAIINSHRALEGVRELKKCALSSRVHALADLTLFRFEFRLGTLVRSRSIMGP
jgi:hypothetical protein